VPGAAGNGRVCEEIVELVDLLPSIAEIAGLEAPTGVEGTSFAPLLDAPGRAWKQAAFSLCSRGEHEWLGRSIRTRRYRYSEWRRGEVLQAELYDLERDPLESVNRAADPLAGEVRAELARRLWAGWRAERPLG